MFEFLREPLLRWLRVPPTPEPPAGSPESIRIFRAGANLFKLKLIQWALAQCALLPGVAAIVGIASFAKFPPRSAWLLIPFFKVLAVLLVVVYVVQFLCTYATLRLNFEMRWYIVTDRSLRIRTGIWKVREITMTFANIQQVNLTRGPLQTFLGLGDLKVTSAGGGSIATAHGHISTAHAASFEGVDNAEAIRDLILDRLKHYRDAGLGDPDEHHAPSTDNPQAAATEVLSEVRKLSAILTSEF